MAGRSGRKREKLGETERKREKLGERWRNWEKEAMMVKVFKHNGGLSGRDGMCGWGKSEEEIQRMKSGEYLSLSCPVLYLDKHM